MSRKNKNLSSNKLEKFDPDDITKIGLVVSDWNEEITESLQKGALGTLTEQGLTSDQIECISVPGTFELPLGARMLLKSKNAQAVICLGCVIKGDTDHDRYINESVAITLNQLAITSGKPVVFGVLTVNTHQQALDRAGGKYGNKGIEAAITALKMLQLQKDLDKPGSTIGF